MKYDFPHFKQIGLEDYDIFRDILSAYKPEVSEYTFTNLFIWRSHYRFHWSIYRDWLLIIFFDTEDSCIGMQPIGPPSRQKATALLLEWLKDEKKEHIPCIQKADERLILELDSHNNLSIEPAREHFDYVYLRQDLVRLEGNKYRSKRNHINKLLRTYNIKYEELNTTYIEKCLELQEKWCQQRRCDEDLNLMGEWDAIREVLANYDALQLRGGVIIIGGRVEAFTIGERLNDNTAVVHIEKADPDIPGLYPIINQQFCENALNDVHYINREQDLGIPGLREAKLSYYPDHFVEKFTIKLL